MAAILRQSCPTTPVLFLYNQEREMAEKIITEFANRKQCRTLVVTLSGVGQTEERLAKKYLQKGMEEGLWVIVQNGHHSLALLNSLETMFAEKDEIDANFRCWITTEAVSNIPTRVLHTCVKVMIDMPRVS